MSDREPIQTVMRVEPADDDAWHAFEPASDRSLKGRGETPPEAIRNYCEVIEARRGEGA